jgi:hypothetical protein
MKYVVRSVRVVSKSAYYLRHACPFIRPSAGISAALTGWISVKFDIEDFYENLSRKSKSGSNQTKISGTVREYFSKFHWCRQYYITLKAPLLLILYLVFSLSVHLSVCLSAYVSAASTRQIYVIFDIGNFHENLLRNSRFG